MICDYPCISFYGFLKVDARSFTNCFFFITFPYLFTGCAFGAGGACMHCQGSTAFPPSCSIFSSELPDGQLSLGEVALSRTTCILLLGDSLWTSDVYLFSFCPFVFYLGFHFVILFFQAWSSDYSPALCAFRCWKSLSGIVCNTWKGIWSWFFICYGSGMSQTLIPNIIVCNAKAPLAYF